VKKAPQKKKGPSILTWSRSPIISLPPKKKPGGEESKSKKGHRNSSTVAFTEKTRAIRGKSQGKKSKKKKVHQPNANRKGRPAQKKTPKKKHEKRTHEFLRYRSSPPVREKKEKTVPGDAHAVVFLFTLKEREEAPSGK